MSSCSDKQCTLLATPSWCSDTNTCSIDELLSRLSLQRHVPDAVKELSDALRGKNGVDYSQAKLDMGHEVRTRLHHQLQQQQQHQRHFVKLLTVAIAAPAVRAAAQAVYHHSAPFQAVKACALKGWTAAAAPWSLAMQMIWRHTATAAAIAAAAATAVAMAGAAD
jgi:hypothetical protein